MEKPKTGEPPSPPAAQQPEETDSPQSPLPDEEGEVDIQPHQQKMLVQFPFQKKKVVGLRRTSLTISGKRRQVAFCPYCGVTNDNAETGLNHVRKHLDVMLVCGGCHTKSVCLGQALQKHMKDNCPAVLAILGKTRGGKK